MEEEVHSPTTTEGICFIIDKIKPVQTTLKCDVTIPENNLNYGLLDFLKLLEKWNYLKKKNQLVLVEHAWIFSCLSFNFMFVYFQPKDRMRTVI